MVETDRSAAMLVQAGGASVRTPVQTIWRLVGVLILVVVVVSSRALPAGAMTIRPLHDRVLVELQLVEATNTSGIVLILFAASIQVDPHGVPHGVIRIDAGDGEPTIFSPVEALVDRDEEQEAQELLILITPHITRAPTDGSMVHVERNLVEASLLDWILSDGAGNRLTFSAPGIIETLPPANGPR